MESNPMFARKAEAILEELARPAVRPNGTVLSPEECLQYAGSFMEMVGIPADTASATLDLIGEVDFDSISTQAIEDAGFIQHVESAMRDDPSGYARNHDAQREYAEALERLNARQPEPSYWTDTDDRRLVEIERKHMCATPGSQEWRDYWQGPLQAEYADLLSRKMAPAALPAAELATGPVD
jgi:hypothetical protein